MLKGRKLRKRDRERPIFNKKIDNGSHLLVVFFSILTKTTLFWHELASFPATPPLSPRRIGVKVEVVVVVVVIVIVVVIIVVVVIHS